MRTPKTKSGTSSTTGGTTISATSTPRTTSRPQKSQCANPHAASAETRSVISTEENDRKSVLPNQRGNWSLSAVRKPDSVGWETGAQGCSRKPACVLNAAVSIT